MSDSLCLQGLYSPWNSPSQNTGVSDLSLLQDIFPAQGSNPDLPHCRWILYQLSHKGSPRILEWVPYLFSSRSSWPRNWTGVSCIAGRFFTNWAMREMLLFPLGIAIFWKRPLIDFKIVSLLHFLWKILKLCDAYLWYGVGVQFHVWNRVTRGIPWWSRS